MKSNIAKKLRGAERRTILNSLSRNAGAFKDKTKYDRAKNKEELRKNEY